MEDLLYIVHRIPYPPNKGDKIRSYNILKYLSSRYRVHLATFVDDPDDLQYIDKVDEYVVDKCVVQIDPFKRKIASLFGLLTGEALSNRFYRSNELQGWVSGKINQDKIDKVFLFSSPMAQFIQDETLSKVKCVMDFVDVDSEKWFQYSEKHTFPMSWLYGREGRALRAFEQEVANSVDSSLFVSTNEADLFISQVELNKPGTVQALFNGVDTVKFDPNLTYESPFNGKEKTIVFTGAMDYWANIEAVVWFCENVWPKVKSQCAEAKFYIVGSKPSDEVKALVKFDDVVVTGFVDEVLPYLSYASLCVAPLRIARGIQNKVLEALAMEKVVIATPQAMEGILGFSNSNHVATVCESPEAYAEKIVAQLTGSEPGRVPAARNYVQENFSWESHLSQLDQLI